MRTGVLFSALLVSMSLAGTSRGEDSSAQARISINADAEFWVGQKVPLVVELLAPGYFADSPVFRLPPVPGVLILPAAGSPTVGSERIGEIGYTVQRHELAVFARRSGGITIPSFEIRVAFKHQPLDHDPLEAIVRTREISFMAKQPPGTTPDESVITSADLTVAESWKPQPGTRAKAGDAFVRTIAWAASDVPGMAFPPFDAGPVDGLGIYPAEAVIHDTSDRGRLHGECTDTVTYVCKTGGRTVIPAVSVRWWNPVEKEMKQMDFPARSFAVTAPPPPPVKFSVRMRRIWQSHREVICGSFGGAALLVAVIHFSRPSIFRAFNLLRPRRLASLNPP